MGTAGADPLTTSANCEIHKKDVLSDRFSFTEEHNWRQRKRKWRRNWTNRQLDHMDTSQLDTTQLKTTKQPRVESSRGQQQSNSLSLELSLSL